MKTTVMQYKRKISDLKNEIQTLGGAGVSGRATGQGPGSGPGSGSRSGSGSGLQGRGGVSQS